MAVLFTTGCHAVRELGHDDLPALQALFQANPDYFVRVGGQPPGPNEARQAFNERPPAHLGFRQRWFAGVVDGGGALRGLLILLSDFTAPGVWHIALFLLDDTTRGTGAAARLHAALQAWAQAAGARWLRLGVVVGNLPAERFWARCGYQSVRTRPFVADSGQALVSRVMVKPLPPPGHDPVASSLASYLALVPRDAPGSTLP